MSWPLPLYSHVLLKPFYSHFSVGTIVVSYVSVSKVAGKFIQVLPAEAFKVGVVSVGSAS